MAALTTALARLRREPMADLPISSRLDQLCLQENHAWRERLLTPLVTLRLFVLQILHGNTAITHLRQLSGIDFSPSSYCAARARLPLAVLQGLVAWLADVGQHSVERAGVLGRRVLIVDGSGCSMPDTADLRAHFGLPRGTPGKIVEGIAYPVARLMGLMDVGTGMFLSLVGAPLWKSEQRQMLVLHPMLRPGDILLGDRGFCSYVQVGLLIERGVDVVLRLHQRRKGKTHGIDRWLRPASVPKWMNREQFALLPASITVRLVRYRIEQAGFRTQEVTAVTTLLDEQAWPDEKIAELYGQRWQIETCFDHLKTTMKMNVLRCQTVEGVMKELAVYLLVYNLVRLAMLRAALRQGQALERISFVDACRWLCCRMLGLAGVELLLVNPRRVGRIEPRVIRRRMKEYDLMKRPRAELKAMMASEVRS